MNALKSTTWLVLVTALALSACGDDSSPSGEQPAAGAAGDNGDGDGDGDTGDGDGDTGDGDTGDGDGDDDVIVGETDPDEFMADAGDGWKTLLTGEWEIPAGDESYRCVRFTVPEDIYITAMKPLIPFGTHHTVLTVGEPDEEDGISVCDVGTNHEIQIGGSGVGTDPQYFPEGVGFEVKAGQQLLLNLHLFNLTEESITGKSGTLMQVAPESEIEHKASVLLAGSVNLNIPAGETTTQTGRCTFQTPGTVVALIPHMHMLGVHMKVTAETEADGDTVLFDDDYAFEQQDQQDVDFVELDAGDTIKVDCTYENDRTTDVHFGDSSLAEMCFAGIVRYPAVEEGTSFTCVN